MFKGPEAWAKLKVSCACAKGIHPYSSFSIQPRPDNNSSRLHGSKGFICALLLFAGRSRPGRLQGFATVTQSSARRTASARQIIGAQCYMRESPSTFSIRTDMRSPCNARQRIFF